MKEELELQLVNKYPNFFRDYRGNPRETCMAWGVEHNDGWFTLLSDLCDYINATLKQKFSVKAKEGYTGDGVDEWGYIILPPPDFYFAQIKEKFATLRVYTNMATDYEEYMDKINVDDFNKKFERDYHNPILNAIEYVEYISSKYCEDCGQRGKIYYDGWYKTYCPDCAKAHNRSDHVDIKEAP